MILNRAAVSMAILLMSLTIAIGIAPNQASAGVSASEILKAMEGNYRGRGTAEITPGRPAERVTCQVSNSYDGKAGALDVEGNCASTQGKSKVSGRITHKGNAVSGALISTVGGSSVTKSTGEMKGDKLRVFTNFSDSVTKRLTKTLQVISLVGQGYRADFYVYKNAKGGYEKTGEMVFSRTK